MRFLQLSLRVFTCGKRQSELLIAGKLPLEPCNPRRKLPALHSSPLLVGERRGKGGQLRLSLGQFSPPRRNRPGQFLLGPPFPEQSILRGFPLLQRSSGGIGLPRELPELLLTAEQRLQLLGLLPKRIQTPVALLGEGARFIRPAPQVFQRGLALIKRGFPHCVNSKQRRERFLHRRHSVESALHPFPDGTAFFAPVRELESRDALQNPPPVFLQFPSRTKSAVFQLPGKPLVNFGVENLAQDLSALFAVRFQQPLKLSLCNHHDLGELGKIQSEQSFDLLSDLFRTAFHTAIRQDQGCGRTLEHHPFATCLGTLIGGAALGDIPLSPVEEFQPHEGRRTGRSEIAAQHRGIAASAAGHPVKGEGNRVKKAGFSGAGIPGNQVNPARTEAGKIDCLLPRVGAESRHGENQRPHAFSSSLSLSKRLRTSCARSPSSGRLFCSS